MDNNDHTLLARIDERVERLIGDVAALPEMVAQKIADHEKTCPVRSAIENDTRHQDIAIKRMQVWAVVLSGAIAGLVSVAVAMASRR